MKMYWMVYVKVLQLNRSKFVYTWYKIMNNV